MVALLAFAGLIFSPAVQTGRADEPRSFEIPETPRARAVSKLRAEIVDLQNRQAKRPSAGVAARPDPVPLTAATGAPPEAGEAGATPGPERGLSGAKAEGYGPAVTKALPAADSTLGKLMPDSMRNLITQPFQDLDANMKKRDADLKALDHL